MPYNMELLNLQSKDYASTADTLVVIQQEVPQYLQNMLLACGYDRLQIIAEINVSDHESSHPNDADKMLDYIKQTFSLDARLAIFIYD